MSFSMKWTDSDFSVIVPVCGRGNGFSTSVACFKATLYSMQPFQG
jgi:hypothetical protein